MSPRVSAGAALMAGLLVACGGSQSPVPVVGRDVDISKLAGQWFGDYSSVETGRSGSILFTLTAGSDTATGNVVMTPRFNAGAQVGQQPQAQTTVPVAQSIDIKFVRVTGGQVSGALAPYTDPTCNCPLHTTFVGRLSGDTLSGSYTSRHENSQDVQQGRWRVVRKAQ
ncbi:MAG TPA: hypothetical protein VIW26_04350 [Gemmatimonadales bacterium]